MADDWKAVETAGIQIAGVRSRLFPIVLGNKGDWSYLVSGLHMFSHFVLYVEVREYLVYLYTVYMKEFWRS